MHTLRNRILFFGPTALLGALSLGLHRYMMENCFDAKGLLIGGNLPGRLLWIVGIGFAVYLIAMLRTIGGEGSYADNFPRCVLSGALMLAAGVLLLTAAPGLELDAGAVSEPVSPLAALMGGLNELAAAYLPYGAAAALAALGVFRILGKRPHFAVSGVVCLFYMLVLVSYYRRWSADPQLHDYAYQLLALVLLMLSSFHRVCCDAEIIQRRQLLFTGLSAAFCCVAALSGGFQRGFYLASGLWAAGSLCNVAVLPPDPEEDKEENPETEPEETENDLLS